MVGAYRGSRPVGTRVCVACRARYTSMVVRTDSNSFPMYAGRRMLRTSKSKKKMRQRSLAVFATLVICGIVQASRAQQQIPGSEALAFTCYTCHSADGTSKERIPTLDGRSAEQLRRLLLGFKKDQGAPTIMNRIAKGYSDVDLGRVADYLSKQK